MEKETIPKFATVIICMIVAITIIMTALVPIISDQTTTTEQTPAEGAYGPSVGYYTIESTPTGTISFFDTHHHACILGDALCKGVHEKTGVR